MNMNKRSFFAKLTATSLMLVASTVNANESSTIDSLLELLFPTETIAPQKNCGQFPDPCIPPKLVDTQTSSDE